MSADVLECTSAHSCNMCCFEENLRTPRACQDFRCRLPLPSTSSFELHESIVVALLQARLVLGVRAELDACKEALLRLYRP